MIFISQVKNVLRLSKFFQNYSALTLYNSQDMEATKCPLTEEWIKNMWYIYIYIYIYTHTHTI